jgi:stage II sporulation protein D
VGSRGSTVVSGPQLRSRLGLYDTWAYFIQIKSGTPTPTSTAPSDPQVTDGGGTSAGAASAGWLRRVVGPRQLIVSGSVSPAPKKITLQKQQGANWRTIGFGLTDPHGRYALLVKSTGAYRVLAAGGVGPVVHIR